MIMAVTPITGAFLDNVGVEKIGVVIRETTVGIGTFDGYATTEAALPAADAGNENEVYFVGDNATPYTSDGSDWNPGAIQVISAKGAAFNIVDDSNVVAIGRFTALPTYDDPETPTTASGGVCEVLGFSSEYDRALTDQEVDDALTAAGF
jgi:hypothetical protein